MRAQWISCSILRPYKHRHVQLLLPLHGVLFLPQSINMLEVIFTLAFHKNAPSVTAICHKALSLCAAKQRSRFPAKPDAVLHDAIKKNKKKLQRRG